MDEDITIAYNRLTAMQALVSHILHGFVHRPLDEVPVAVSEALSQLGTFCHADRSYVFEMRDVDRMDNTYEWCATGIKPEKDNLQDLPRDIVHFWLAPLAAGEPVHVTDVQTLPESRADERNVLIEQGIQSLLVVPMLNAGELFGFVGFDAVRSKRIFAAGEQSLLASVADIVCSALVRREAARQVTHAQERLAAITENASDLVFIIDEKGAIIWTSSSVERLFADNIKNKSFLDLIDKNHGLAFKNAFQEEMTQNSHDHSSYELPDCLVATPRGGRWLETRAMDLRKNPAVNGIVLTARDITDRRIIEDRLSFQATHDTLTKLPNRNLLLDRLEQASQRAKINNSNIGILFIDIDRFKLINDGHGHSAGDSVLCEVANRISKSIRPVDTVCRFGGDEFVVLLENIDDQETVERCATELSKVISQPIKINGLEFFITSSIGLLIRRGCNVASEEVLQHADAAMYRAKEVGRNTIIPFSSSINNQVSLEAKISQKLQRAINDSDIYPVFQPIIEMNSGKITGYESLARWHDTELGYISPVDFINIAERTGQIRALGLCMLTQAIQKAAKINGDWVLTVNISRRELEAPYFSSKVIDICKNNLFSPNRLCLEITESAVALQPTQALETLNLLKSHGIKLAIDDFGTGYSSFYVLHSSTFDYIKIDRSFVKDLSYKSQDVRLVKSVINLAKDFNLSVIAEGIETDEQMEILISQGCNLGQGFFLGRPEPLC